MTRNAKVYIALLHYPMYNKNMDVITTSITNLDLHDISRSARTYDVDGFFAVHPSENQQQLIKDIAAYWQEGYGGNYNSDRREAFGLLKLFSNLNQVLAWIADETGQAAITVATDARAYPNHIGFKELKNRIRTENKVYLILFGTGWGIQSESIEQCDLFLEPIEAGRNYNHLSVRSAVSIILDRLLGETWFI